MKLGLITDIHEHVDLLRIALARLAKERVDKIVFIGDIVELGERLEETCRLLAEAKVIGVWGNHDFGLCANPDEYMRATYSQAIIEYMTSLRPRLEVAGCYFTHVEPWLDPEELIDLWYFEGPPDEQGKLDRIFNAVPHRYMFGGHYHRWLLVTPEGISDWHGDRPIRLDGPRYFVVIGALCDGCYATFDTESGELMPFNEPHMNGED